jgi:hypothetical protein
VVGASVGAGVVGAGVGEGLGGEVGDGVGLTLGTGVGLGVGEGVGSMRVKSVSARALAVFPALSVKVIVHEKVLYPPPVVASVI